MSIKNSNSLYQGVLKQPERFAIWITKKVGSIGFFFLIFLWTVTWIGWNVLAPKPYCFDPYPAFVFWLFISNMIQIFLMPLIMVGQNLQGKHAEIRAENDYRINRKAEQEIATLAAELKEVKTLLQKMLDDKSSRS